VRGGYTSFYETKKRKKRGEKKGGVSIYFFAFVARSTSPFPSRASIDGARVDFLKSPRQAKLPHSPDVSAYESPHHPTAPTGFLTFAAAAAVVGGRKNAASSSSSSSGEG